MLPAVAENQPSAPWQLIQNRMNELVTFPGFTAALDHFIRQSLHSPRPVSGELEPEFDALALALFGLQFEHNLPYRRFCESRRQTPELVTGWRQIPAVPTAAFKELDLTSLPAAGRTHVFHSSGTTGQQPSRHFHSAGSLALYEASLWPWFEQHLLVGAGDAPGMPSFRVLSLTPAPGDAPQSSLAHMCGVVAAKLDAGGAVFCGVVQASGWNLDVRKFEADCESCTAPNQPVLVLGTAFQFLQLADELGLTGRSFRLPPGSRVMETGGYKGRTRTLPKAQLHALISGVLGVPLHQIVCEYGMSELSSQAYDLVAGQSFYSGPRRFQFPPWARALIVSPESGEPVAEGQPGLLRVYDLANVWSVMSLQTEDLAIHHEDGFELLGRDRQAEPRGCSLLTTTG